MCRKPLRPAVRIPGSRQRAPLPSKTAAASWILRRAVRFRRNLPNPQPCALPASPHPASPASPRAPQNRLESPQSRSSWALSSSSPVANHSAGRWPLSPHSARPLSYSISSSLSSSRLSSKLTLPAACREQFFLFQLPHVNSRHRFAEFLRRFQNRLRILEVRRRLHNRLRPRVRIAALENARADKHRFRAQLPHQRRICRSRNATRRKIWYRQLARLRNFPQQIERRAHLLRRPHQLVIAQRRQPLHLRHDRAHMPHRFHHVAGARFALRADHRRALRNPPYRFAEVARAANEWHAIVVLPDVVLFVRRS